MNGTENERLWRALDENKNDHREIIKKLDSLDAILRTQPQECGKRFVDSRVFFWIIPFVVTLICSSFAYAYYKAEALWNFVLKFHSGV